MPSNAVPAARHRLLEVAARLFYNQGYYRTGVREIVKRSRTAVSSFYDHFASKEEIATAYLESESEKTQHNLRALMTQHPDLRDFVRAWMLAKKKEIRSGVFVGCPFSGFSYQSAAPDPAHREALQTAAGRWVDLLAAFVQANQNNGIVRKEVQARLLAERVLIYYQGAVAMWRMSGRREYIEEMGRLIRQEVAAATAPPHRPLAGRSGKTRRKIARA